jgi:hypothetical protein
LAIPPRFRMYFVNGFRLRVPFDRGGCPFDVNVSGKLFSTSGDRHLNRLSINREFEWKFV